ncbi:MAG: hypothetical protein J6P87_07270 [Lachnospiraceae bacterium]|nr:hypothetical protein [Lachnospiraceae bacterium]
MKNKERLMGMIMTVIMSVAMGIVASFLVLKTNPAAAEAVSAPAMYISNILLSVAVGFIVSFLVPLGKLGTDLAHRCGAYPPSMKFNLLNAIPLAVGNTLIISLIVSFVGVAMARAKMPAEAIAHMPPMAVMWLGSWVKLLIPTMIISYVLSIVLAPVISRKLGIGGGPAGR